MLQPLLVVIAALQTPIPAPVRAVPDPGVIATGQRITPAGVQSVFSGKVAGVRFGTTSDDIWVAVPGSVQHVAWRDNRTIARVRVDGHPGVFALTVDPVTRRVLSS